MTTFSKDDLLDGKNLDFKSYARKITMTQAVRIEGPFEVETLEGTMSCPDGWLALDSEGNPYPIAAAVFDNTFHPRPLGEPEGGSSWHREDLI